MSNADEQQWVEFSKQDGIASVRLNRPERRNALAISMVNRLHELWCEVDDDDDIRVVILSAAPCPTFCAGMDLKEASQIKQETGKDVLGFLKDPFHARMREVKKPIIGALTGDLMAGGMLLGLNCDLRVGLKGTRVGITEAKVGRGSPWGVPLLWMIPQAILLELTLTADLLPVEQLHGYGFTNYLEPDYDAVIDRAMQLAETIRDNAPLSVEAGKQSIYMAADLGAEAGLTEARKIYEKVYSSEDGIEGPRAFAEKRKPVWKGR
ncbi:MAG: enoyl-CoA hydratase-related protein [Gammaproteobacteria bacterium]